MREDFRMDTYREDRKALEESLKDEKLVKMRGGLGKRFGGDACYVALLCDTWICGGGFSEEDAREDALARGVSTPRVLDVATYFDRKYWPNIRIGYNPWTGKHVLEKRDYHRKKEKVAYSPAFQV